MTHPKARFRTISAAETEHLAEKIAEHVLRRGAVKQAVVLALRGELGSGKTTFAQGFLRGLGLKQPSPSPTFILWRRFTLRRDSFTSVFHVDAYRIKKAEELFALGLKEILTAPGHIVLLEWPERLGRGLPRSALRIEFRHGRRPSERLVSVPKSINP